MHPQAGSSGTMRRGKVADGRGLDFFREFDAASDLFCRRMEVAISDPSPTPGRGGRAHDEWMKICVRKDRFGND